MFKSSLTIAALSVALFSSSIVMADDIGFGGGGQGGNQGARQYVNEAQAVQVTKTVSTASGQRTKTTTIVLQYGLNIGGYITPGQRGLVVNRVSPGPATNMRGFGTIAAMERGDVLDSINGHGIYSPSDYHGALNAASWNLGAPVRLGVRDINTGRVNYFTTYLTRI